MVKQLDATTHLQTKKREQTCMDELLHLHSPSPLIYAELMTDSIACLQILNCPELRSGYAAAMTHSIACLQIPVIVASGPYTCDCSNYNQIHLCRLR